MPDTPSIAAARNDLAVGNAGDEFPQFIDESVGVHREAAQLRQLTDDDGEPPGRSCIR